MAPEKQPASPPQYEPIIMPEALLQPLSVAMEPVVEIPRSLYWYGVLPAADAHDAFYPKPKVSAQGIEYVPARRWSGRCNYQQLRMGGLSFSAWTTERFVVGGTEDAEMQIRPGCLGRWTDEQIKSILQNVSRHVLRWVNETTAHHMHLDQPFYRADKFRDRPVAQYVYIVKLGDESQRPDMRRFLKDPPLALGQVRQETAPSPATTTVPPKASKAAA